ncbi:unnamed protein product, partial [Oppiella nova]
MLWIHGGGFQAGAGGDYDGTQLAANWDVVVVTINYRLGALGFLCTDRPDAPGNVGLWDQAMAMQWVKKYITNFGGNPNDITVFGESSGSISISAHILSNVTQSYFKKAIMESGSVLTNLQMRSKAYTTRLAMRYAQQLGCDPKTTPDYVKCMRSTTISFQ